MTLGNKIITAIAGIIFLCISVWNIRRIYRKNKEKAMTFYSAEISGRIKSLGMSKGSVLMYVSDYDNEFSLHPYENIGKKFIDVASIGDTVRKRKYGDSVYLVKPDTTYVFEVYVPN